MLRRQHTYLASALFLTFCLSPYAVAQFDDLRSPLIKESHGSIDILSDTEGVNFGPFLQNVVHRVRMHWYPVVPEVARAPIMKQGTVTIEFAIMKDGRVAGLQNIESSGDISMDHAARTSIVLSDPFPALPSDFHGQYIALRFHFDNNPSNLTIASATTTAKPPSERGGIPLPTVRVFIRTLSGRDISIHARRFEIPSYPKRAVQAKQSGIVQLSVLITKNGDVRHVEIQQGISQDLDHRAVSAIKHWKFEPFLLDGKAADMPARVVTRFDLN